MKVESQSLRSKKEELDMLLRADTKMLTFKDRGCLKDEGRSIDRENRERIRRIQELRDGIREIKDRMLTAQKAMSGSQPPKEAPNA